MRNLFLFCLSIMCMTAKAQTNNIASLRKYVEKDTNSANKKIQEFILNYPNISDENKVKLYNSVIITNGVVTGLKDYKIITSLPTKEQTLIFKTFLNNDNFIIYNNDGSEYLSVSTIKNNTPNSNWANPFISGYKLGYRQTGGNSCIEDCEPCDYCGCWWVKPCR